MADVLLVGGNAGSAGNTALAAALSGDGHTVTFRSQAVTPRTGTGYDAVVLASDTSSGTIAAYGSIPEPLVNLAHATWDTESGLMSGSFAATTSNTQVNILTAHEIVTAAGLSTGPVAVASSSGTFRYTNTVGSQATIIAAVGAAGDADDACMWVYEAGDLLADETTTAPSRRVATFPLDETAALLNTDGMNLFLAAVNWAAGVGGGPGPISGTAEQILPALTQDASGSHAPPAATGSTAQTLPSLTQAASGAHAAPTSTGTASSTLPPVTSQAAGIVTAPVFTGDAAQALPALTQAAAGDTTAPVYTATATSTLAVLTQSAAGTSAPPDGTGAAEQALPGLTQAATGETVAPSWTGPATSDLPSLAQASSGTTAGPGAIDGAATSGLPSFTQGLIGDFVPPEWVAEVAQSLPAMAQAAAGTHVSVAVGVIAQTLAAISQAAGDAPFRNITLTVGAPYLRWQAELVERWDAGTPTVRWHAGTPSI